jgi:hypothetical protein
MYYCGRMMAVSKTGYQNKYPDSVCLWNANVFTKGKGKIWWGDLDLTRDAEELKRFAKDQGEELFILRERDGRFDNEQAPDLSLAVARIAP